MRGGSEDGEGTRARKPEAKAASLQILGELFPSGARRSRMAVGGQSRGRKERAEQTVPGERCF